ncbi:hypothetical protein MMC34_006250 [Xylographa carneopallida]|nr:hypothetical protein [Xylographa carneopallida]
MAEINKIAASEDTALVLHEDLQYHIVRFNGGTDESGPMVALIAVYLESPLVTGPDFFCPIPLYRYGPTEQIGETMGHVAFQFGTFPIEIVVRQVSVHGVLHFLFLLRTGFAGAWTFQKSIFSPHDTTPGGRKAYYNNQIDNRRAKGGNDILAYVISHVDAATGELKTYHDSEEMTGYEYEFLLHALADDEESEDAVYATHAREEHA